MLFLSCVVLLLYVFFLGLALLMKKLVADPPDHRTSLRLGLIGIGASFFLAGSGVVGPG